MNKQITRYPVWVLLVICTGSFFLYAYQTGITGRTLKNGEGCTCHNPTPYPEVSVVINGPDTLAPGEQAVYTVTITGGELVRGGTNIAASNGVLATVDTSLRFEADELTHVWPKEPADNAVTFQFSYTAPSVPGTEILYANGNSVNYNGENTGDKWNFALNKTVTIASPPPATFQLSVNINNGWNMVSIPGYHPVNQNVTTWWAGKDPAAAVFKFQGNYQTVTSVEPGSGYWMKHIGTQTYNTGDEWPAGGIQFVPHNPINGAAGWNLIGIYETSVQAANITTTPPGLITGSVYKYQGGYTAVPTLDPGYGYWVKLSAAGQINIPSGSDAVATLKAKNTTEGMGKIIITDHSGKSYSLYAAGNGTNLSQFELPPVPPQGIFDVRYASSRYVEKLKNQIQEIDLSGVQYPIKIRTEDVRIILSDKEGRRVAAVNSDEEVTLNTAADKLFITEDLLPAEYSLGQNYPNPFNPSTTINFTIPEDVQNVKLIIFNSVGEKIAELLNNSLSAGSYNYTWNAPNTASGLYIYQLITEKFVSTKKMVLLK